MKKTLMKIADMLIDNKNDIIQRERMLRAKELISFYRYFQKIIKRYREHIDYHYLHYAETLSEFIKNIDSIKNISLESFLTIEKGEAAISGVDIPLLYKYSHYIPERNPRMDDKSLKSNIMGLDFLREKITDDLLTFICKKKFKTIYHVMCSRPDPSQEIYTEANRPFNITVYFHASTNLLEELGKLAPTHLAIHLGIDDEINK